MHIDISSLRGLDAHRSADAELAARLEELNTEAAGQPFDDDQRGEWEQILKDRDTLGATITELEHREQAVAAALGEKADKGGSESPKFGLPNIKRAAADIFDLGAYRDKVRSIDDLPGAYREGAMRVLDQMSFPTAVAPDQAKARVASLIERHKNERNGWVSQHVIATSSPAYAEAWAAAMLGRPVSPKMQAVLQSYSDSDGALALPVAIDPTFINTSDGAVNPLRDISRVETTVSKQWKAITTGGVTAAYVGERTTTGASDGAPSDVDDPTVTPVRADVSVDITLEYDQDYGSAALMGELGSMIQIAKDDLEADKFALGDGSGEPEGVIYAIVTDTTSLVSTITNDVFARADLDKLEEAVPPRFRSRSTIVLNKRIQQVIRGFGTAGEPVNALYDADAGTLLGYPRRELSAMDNVATDGKKIVLMGDFKAGFVIVDRLGLFSKVLDTRDSNGRPTGGQTLYAAWRNSSKVLFFNAFRLLKVQ